MKITSKQRSTTAALLASIVALTGCGGGGGSGGSKRASAAPVTSGSTTPIGSGQSPNTNGGTIASAPLNDPRGAHTATSTAAGVLVVGGEGANSQILDSVELFENGAWRKVGSLAAARKGHTATLLASGEVLVVGGQADAAGTNLLASTELLNPATGAVRPGPSLSRARAGHTASSFTTSAGEFVLIAGGASNGATIATAELYDARSNQLLPVAAAMVQDRVDARAVTLANGKVLIQGGLTGISAASFQISPAGAELFDPATQTFSRAGQLGSDRFGGGLQLLDSGRVVALGGNSAARTEPSLEVYDPATNSWSLSSVQLAEAREGLAVVALASSELLAIGGSDQGPSATVERFDGLLSAAPARLASLLEARRQHTATRLANGNVLVVGGFNLSGPVATSEEYLPGAPVSGPITPPVVQPPVVTPPVTPTGPAPAILALFPTKGKPGDIITIAGRNFGPKKADNQVFFNGNVQGKVMFDINIKSLPLLGSVQTLIVEVPSGAQTGDLAVITAGQRSGGKNFTIDLQSGGTPQVLYTLPRKAKVGGIVSIFGRNFARPATDNVVRFAGVQARLIGGITTQSLPFIGNVSVMLVNVPSGAVTGDLTIEAAGKVSRGYSFEVTGTTPATTPTTPSTTTTPTTPTTPSTPTTPTTPSTTTRTFFSEDFEGASVKFNTSGGLWQASQPRTVGPRAAASGSWCAGTNMTTGSYTANARGYLITREIDLTQATTAELTFKQWYDTDGVDAGRVVISPDNGTTFYLVRPQGSVYKATSVFTPAEGITGTSGQWTTATVDLSRYAGNRILVIFDFKSDGANQKSGWYIDDVAVTGF